MIMSVGKRDKPDNNCQIPVYWVLGNGIVTIDLNNDKNYRLRKIIAVLPYCPCFNQPYFQPDFSDKNNLSS
jgi:hypothetical protein